VTHDATCSAELSPFRHALTWNPVMCSSCRQPVLSYSFLHYKTLCTYNVKGRPHRTPFTSFRHNSRQIILTKFPNWLDNELDDTKMLLPNIPSDSICQLSNDKACPWMLAYTHNQQQFPCRHESLKWWTSVLSRCGWQYEKTESPYRCYHLSSVQEATYTMINITSLWQ